METKVKTLEQRQTKTEGRLRALEERCKLLDHVVRELLDQYLERGDGDDDRITAVG